jgi:hypothetical protein
MQNAQVTSVGISEGRRVTELSTFEGDNIKIILKVDTVKM